MSAGEHGIGHDSQCPAVCAGLHQNPNSGLVWLAPVLFCAVTIVILAIPAVLTSTRDLSLGGAVR